VCPPENNSNNPSDPTPVYAIPQPLQVFETFNTFLIRWANQTAKFETSPTEDMVASLPLEQGILFRDPFAGMMVIRSAGDFEKFLEELVSGKKPGKEFDSKRNELFLEMTVLFWHLFVFSAWRLDSRRLQAAILKPTVPLDWPDRKPDTFCRLFIKGFPLEILLWSYLSENEMRNWKKR
jgi:hypothetical protein